MRHSLRVNLFLPALTVKRTASAGLAAETVKPDIVPYHSEVSAVDTRFFKFVMHDDDDDDDCDLTQNVYSYVSIYGVIHPLL